MHCGAVRGQATVARSYQVLISTSLRSGKRVDGQGEEVSGSLLLGTIDTEARSFRLIKQVEVPPSTYRRGRNSVRGIARFGDGFAVCNTTQLFLFDRNLEHITGLLLGEAVRRHPLARRKGRDPLRDGDCFGQHHRTRP